MEDVITLKGDRDLWVDFVNKLRKEKKTVWSVLSPLLKKYLKKG